MTGYTAASNILVERYYGVICSLARSVLLQETLSTSYWDYDIQHVALCKNLIPHSTTEKSPLVQVYGRDCVALKITWRFWCKMLYHPFTEKLPTFDARLHNGIFLGQEGDGVFVVFTEGGPIYMKHRSGKCGRSSGYETFRHMWRRGGIYHLQLWWILPGNKSDDDSDSNDWESNGDYDGRHHRPLTRWNTSRRSTYGWDKESGDIEYP